jgi:hypothetical protein
VWNESKAYKKVAPVQDVTSAEAVSDSLMDTEVKLRVKDLLAVAGDVWNNVRIRLTNRRQAVLPNGNGEGDKFNNGSRVKQTRFDDEIHVIPPPKVERVFHLENLSEIITKKVPCEKGESFRVIDPICQFLQANPGAMVKVMVGAPFMSLRSVLPVVNEAKKVECILDNGSSIVSMSKDTALELGIGWNPKWRIFLESANNMVNQALGVAFNIPFCFNHITVRLQVHILEEAAYKVLLGRPFDCLTQSRVRNFMDGKQLITLTSLHTGEEVKIGSYDRGKLPPEAEPSMGPPEAISEKEVKIIGDETVEEANFH